MTRGTPLRIAGPLLALLLLACAALAQEGVTFPALTGRVVDAAGILTPEQEEAIAAPLEAHEDKTSDQVVVATVPSLQNLTIEDYANRLFRHWALGAKARNNGVLLLVAPTERKVRIEVGYGLEGVITDALTKVIISGSIAPKFKAGDFAGGIRAGTDAVLGILDRDAGEWQRRPEVRDDESHGIDPIVVLILVIVLCLVLSRFLGGGGGGGGRPHRRRNGGWIVVPGPPGGGFSGGGWGGGFGGGGGGGFGGGFSGGGGSSGGGGASGDW
ncbi:MAG: TPM domain-containing protein [Methylobacterium frigidaeris]